MHEGCVKGSDFNATGNMKIATPFLLVCFCYCFYDTVEFDAKR